ncbi:MAG: bifunctional DNA-formamidopyrimidine glycosylase/DNA-(apurinic or apyrimidinic site) lyase [Alphaproteobacteria bacterium]|nr:bifunctional DNA-formamidopyrimidine glycosylase/DNA-(apurinic or apyrimidinic site) lyase [Alphaproteobacteria bacterium]
MPELPEVETIRRGLADVLPGRVIRAVDVRRPDLRVPFPERFVERVTGQTVISVLRRGKYLVMPLGSGESVIFHLGMSGRISIAPESRWDGPKTHDHLVWRIAGGAVVAFNDARRFGMVLMSMAGAPWQAHPAFASMGPEPLGNEFFGQALMERLVKGRRPLKTALLDQSVVAGLGNIYVCEALFLAGLSPFLPCNQLDEAGADRLVRAVRTVLTKAIEAGGSTLRDYARINGETGYFQFAFSVYDRESRRCPDCACDLSETGGVRRVVQAGRSTFYCPVKQEES